MENNKPPDICPLCSSPVRRIPPGVSKRTGKPYFAFFACSNQDCDWTKRGDSLTNNSKIIQKEDLTKNQMMNEFEGINKRLDALASYLKEHIENN